MVEVSVLKLRKYKRVRFVCWGCEKPLNYRGRHRKNRICRHCNAVMMTLCNPKGYRDLQFSGFLSLTEPPVKPGGQIHTTPLDPQSSDKSWIPISSIKDKRERAFAYLVARQVAGERNLESCDGLRNRQVTGESGLLASDRLTESTPISRYRKT
jgi:hypothetical protein